MSRVRHQALAVPQGEQIHDETVVSQNESFIFEKASNTRIRRVQVRKLDELISSLADGSGAGAAASGENKEVRRVIAVPTPLRVTSTSGLTLLYIQAIYHIA